MGGRWGGAHLLVALLVPRLTAHDVVLDGCLLHPRLLHGVAHSAPHPHAGVRGDGEVAGDGLEQCACSSRMNAQTLNSGSDACGKEGGESALLYDRTGL